MKAKIYLAAAALAIMTKSQKVCSLSNSNAGMSFYDDPNLTVQIELLAGGDVAKIKKSDECFESVYDVQEETFYLEFVDKSNTYKSVYTQKN